jgi:hypothetical protein
MLLNIILVAFSFVPKSTKKLRFYGFRFLELKRAVLKKEG